MTTTYVTIGVVLVLIFGVWLAFRHARKRGEAEAEGKASKRAVKRARQANEIDEDVSRLSDADLDDELPTRRG